MNATETKNKPVDALGLWDKEAATAASTVELIRIDGNEHMVLPFSVDVVPVEVHYLDFPSNQGYFRCNGSDCLLCRIGRKKERRDLWPVYDLVARQVGVLAISPNTRPNALRPQLIPIMRRLANSERCVVTVRQEDRKYFVGISALTNEVDDGVAIIERFDADTEAGRIDLTSVYTQLPNDELAKFPEIATLMKVKGVSS